MDKTTTHEHKCQNSKKRPSGTDDRVDNNNNIQHHDTQFAHTTQSHSSAGKAQFVESEHQWHRREKKHQTNERNGTAQ